MKAVFVGIGELRIVFRSVKDVIFNEDRSAIRMGNAPAKRSVILAIALNVLRRNGYSSITSAQRLITNDIDKLLLLVE
ncbi:MAG: hypothetical protein KME57_07630 [Scytonema hyalinum WJT4-NPBG1]|nr:hypothetical protein [Scytonema hyalinum WJT4-NPBG1]